MRSSIILVAYVATVANLLSGVGAFAGNLVARGPKAIPKCFPAPRAPIRAPLMTDKYPYLGAKIDGRNGSEVGGVPVPMPGDKDHYFEHPLPGAYRGPCPGLNAAANHGFISRDGFTTFDELVSMHQNMYNMAYNLSVALATLGIAVGGNVHTGTTTIGPSPSCLGMGEQAGLDFHDAFEADTSLTRNDYYLFEDRDVDKFNGTLFAMMRDSMKVTSNTTDIRKISYDKKGMSWYRGQRYDQSRADNGQFHFGVNVLILYGAASTLYEVFPGEGGKPDYPTITSFFGAKENRTGGYDFIDERIPNDWKNIRRPFTLMDLASNIRDQYLMNPRPFGHNTGRGNFTEDVRQFPKNGTSVDMLCFLYNHVADNFPGPKLQPVSITNFIKKHVNPHFAPFCPISQPEFEAVDFVPGQTPV